MLIGAWVASACGVPDLVGGEHYACEVDAECAHGYICDPGLRWCVRPSGQGDAAVPPADAGGRGASDGAWAPDIEPIARPDAEPIASPDAADAGLSPDADLLPPPIVPITPTSAVGDPGRRRMAPGPAHLSAVAVRWRIDIGARPSNAVLLSTHLDADGVVDAVVVEGDRAVAYTIDGRVIWTTPPLDIATVGGAFDFDADGRVEVLVEGAHGVSLLDALTGALRWTSPPDTPTRPGTVLVTDANRDGRPDLYVADRACGGDDDGVGHLFSFTDGFAGAAAISHIPTDSQADPRDYRCGRWQVVADLDGDGRLEVTVPDRGRLVAIDLHDDLRFDINGASVVWTPHRRDAIDRTTDIRFEPLTDGMRVMLARDEDGDGLVDALELRTTDGAVNGRLPVAEKQGAAAVVASDVPGAVASPAVPPPALPPRWILATSTRGIGLYDETLALLNDADGDDKGDLDRPTGTARLAAGDLGDEGRASPVLLTQNGRLVALDPEGRVRWQKSLHRTTVTPQVESMVPGGPHEIVAFDGRDTEQQRWLVLDGATGDEKVVLTLFAADDDRLAAWRVVIVGPDTDVVLRAEPLIGSRATRRVTWTPDGPPGQYMAVARVSDRAGWATETAVVLQVCGPAGCAP